MLLHNQFWYRNLVSIDWEIGKITEYHPYTKECYHVSSERQKNMDIGAFASITMDLW